jgi:hypothetical protein
MKHALAIVTLVILTLTGISQAQVRAQKPSLRFDGFKAEKFQFSRLTERHSTLHLSVECDGTDRITYGQKDWINACDAVGDIGTRYFDVDEDTMEYTYFMFSNKMGITHQQNDAGGKSTSYFRIINTYETPCIGKGIKEVCK